MNTRAFEVGFLSPPLLQAAPLCLFVSQPESCHFECCWQSCTSQGRHCHSINAVSQHCFSFALLLHFSHPIKHPKSFLYLILIRISLIPYPTEWVLKKSECMNTHLSLYFVSFLLSFQPAITF